MKFSIKDFFGKCDQICKKLRMWSHLFTEEFLNGKLHFFCAVLCVSLDEVLILDKSSLLKAELWWFYYSLSLYIKEEIQNHIYFRCQHQQNTRIQ